MPCRVGFTRNSSIRKQHSESDVAEQLAHGFLLSQLKHKLTQLAATSWSPVVEDTSTKFIPVERAMHVEAWRTGEIFWTSTDHDETMTGTISNR